VIQTVQPGSRAGAVAIPASKSVAHRLLICAALSGEHSALKCDGLSKDITATMACLTALGAAVTVEEGNVLAVTPIGAKPAGEKHLACGESGSTLRFLLPVAAALGAEAVFHPEGRLSQRPITELSSQLEAHGAVIRKGEDTLSCSGQLTSGTYTLPGNVSSQYISGLLFALPLLEGDSRLNITGKIESSAYLTLTEQALALSGIRLMKDATGYTIPGNQSYSLTGARSVEGDWSNGAFFLCMGALSEKGITVSGLNLDSAQGDKQILPLLERFGAEIRCEKDSIFVRKGEARPLIVDAAEIPDLVPVLSVLLMGAEGKSEITHAERLRLKESDRLQSTVNMLKALGGIAEETEAGMVLRGTGALRSGTVAVENDHRIAMSAAVAATLCSGEVTIPDAQCTDKSYPTFWETLNKLEVTP